MTKFCKDCKHFIERYDSEPVCRMAVVSTDPVWGAIKFRECRQERMDHNPCGSAGTLFEPKKPLISSSTNKTILDRIEDWFWR